MDCINCQVRMTASALVHPDGVAAASAREENVA